VHGCWRTRLVSCSGSTDSYVTVMFEACDRRSRRPPHVTAFSSRGQRLMSTSIVLCRWVITGQVITAQDQADALRVPDLR
jgi:hypothetical protein